VRRDDDRQAAPHAGQLLDCDRVRQRVEPGAPLLFRKRDAEEAHLAELGDDVGREPPFRFVLVDLGLDLVREVVADGLAQQLVLGRKVEIHEQSG
jgi:hypothetical protein